MDKKKRNIIIALAVAIIIVTIIILVSVLTRKEYTITFNSNGGTEINAVKVKKDGLLEKPDDPVKDGYVFEGWYYNDELFDFTTKIDKNITLEARYSIVSEFSLNTNSLSLTVGDSATLEANEKDDLTWNSSDEEVVIVEDGKLTALKVGSAIITVTNKDGKSVSCEVTVKEKEADEVLVSNVTISGSKEVQVGSTIKLTAKITPNDATNKDVTWTSSNETIAKVDKNGKVTALKEGVVTITVTTNNGKTATIRITVTTKKETTPVSGSNNEKDPTPSGSQTTPSGSGNGSTSGNPTTGGNSGNSGGNSGSTGDSGSTKPETNPQPSNPTNPDKDSTVSVTGIEVNKDNISLYVGDSETITVTVKPDNATNKDVTWSIKSGSNFVSVSNGRITGRAAGNAVVQVCSKDGNKCAEIKVTVNEKIPEKVPVNKITITGKSSMDYGTDQKLSVEVGPTNATNKDVTWSVTNGATIDSSGKVKITGDVEKVTVTATAKDGSGTTATFEITVNPVYTMIIKPKDMGAGMGVTQYTFVINKNGIEFPSSNIEELTLNNTPIYGRTYNKSTIQASIVKENNNVGTIKVNGKTFNLVVKNGG